MFKIISGSANQTVDIFSAFEPSELNEYAVIAKRVLSACALRFEDLDNADKSPFPKVFEALNRASKPGGEPMVYAIIVARSAAIEADDKLAYYETLLPKLDLHRTAHRRLADAINALK